MGKKTVFINGNIITMNKGAQCEALQIEEDRIINIGSNEEILRTVPNKGVQILDLEGRTVVPGFIDSHVHLMSTLLNEIALDLSQCKSIKEVLSSLEDYIKGNTKLKLMYCTNLSEFNLKEKRMPSRYELDLVSKNIPVVISSLEFHTVILNTFAMHMFRIPFTVEHMEKDGDNRFTGKMRNRASMIARKKMYELLKEDIYFEKADELNKKVLAKGVTEIVTMEGGALFHEKHVDMVINNMDRFIFDINLFYSTVNVSKAMAYQLPRVGGDVFLDGSFRSHNAAIYDEYKDKKDCRGNLFFSRDELMEFIREADNNDLQISVHAVGGRAIDMLLDCYEEILDTGCDMVNPLRHRIEHFELPTDRQIKRAKQLDLILCMHPNYEHYFKGPGDMYESRLGKERASNTNRFRQIIDSGIRVIGGSDSDVMPINPLLGIHAAVNHSNRQSQISVYEGLQMYTTNASYAINKERLIGTIEIGKRADFVVLNKSPLNVKREKVKDIAVVRTYKNGVCVYDREA